MQYVLNPTGSTSFPRPIKTREVSLLVRCTIYPQLPCVLSLFPFFIDWHSSSTTTF